VINTLSPDFPNSRSFVRHTPDPTLELKPLPDSLKYVFLGYNESFPMISASDMNEDKEGKLLKVFRKKQRGHRVNFG